MGRCGVCIGRLIEFAVESSKEIPASAVFGLQLGGAFGVGAAVGLVGFWLLTLRARNWRAALDGDERLPERELATC